MNFKEIFDFFIEKKQDLKVVSVASADLKGKPNSGSKMLMEILPPDKILFLDYKSTTTYANLLSNPQLSVSFMDDAAFTGYRLTGIAQIINSGPDFEIAKESWERRRLAYVGSSRVDLQACKLEYSIVSPK